VTLAVSLPIVDHRATCGEAICPYCGVGCRLWAEAAYGTVLRVKGVADCAANLGRICAKGVLLPSVLNPPDRLTQPQFRARRSDDFQPTTWPKALQFAAARLHHILNAQGPAAIAFYGSGQLDTEAAYLAVKLFKGHLRTNNTDSNSRLCMASAVAGYVTSLGSDGPPTCYDDIDVADLIVIIGSNMAEAHPVTFDRIRDRRARNAGCPQLVVIDPRRTKTAEVADLHVPLAPGSDVALLNLVSRRLLSAGRLDHEFISAHTEGFEEFQKSLLAADEATLLQAINISPTCLDELVRRIANARSLLSFYCMGLGQSTAGVAKHNSLINWHLMTGQIAKPGAGPFSLTGQPNAMGGREAGLLAHQLPAYRLVQHAEHRREMERFWQLPVGHIATQPGRTAVEMFRGLETGRIRAIWIAATNPAASLPDLHQVRRALARAELVIVQDVYHPTETTRFAHVLFPAANWAEKEGTTTNSERTVTLSDKLLDPPGAALPDWQIIASLARALGLPNFEYQHRDEVWDEFRQLTAGRPCDMSGITAQRLRRDRCLQWPCPDLCHPGTKRRYLDRTFPTVSGRAQFIYHEWTPPKEAADREFPLVLTSGRLYAHWHTLTRTGKAEKLVARDPQPYVEIHPDDAQRHGIADGQTITLQSRRGTIHLPARTTTNVRPGLLFAPFHWGDLWGADRAINYLTIAALDPQSSQPELKYCAVAIEPTVTQQIASSGSELALPRADGILFRWLRHKSP